MMIGAREVGDNNPCYIIAEAGVNHNGDINLALKLVDVAKDAGVDAIKFQTFTPELLVTEGAPQADYQSRNTGKAESQIEMLRHLVLSTDDHKKIQSHCKVMGIEFLSTPFSEPDADFLETLSVAAYKVSSGDLDNLPFLEHIAKKQKPMIVSSGMGTMEEVIEAIRVIHSQGNFDIIILHSTSNYPPSFESLNLRVIYSLVQELESFNVLVGYSDNGSAGIGAEIAAVSLGAQVIEKHFTLDKGMPGPDHKASLDPEELGVMVRAIRDTEKMLGSPVKQCTAEEEPIKKIARRSLVAADDIPKGTRLEKSMITMLRPGTGLSPKELPFMIGRVARRQLKKHEQIAFADLVEV